MNKKFYTLKNHFLLIYKFLINLNFPSCGPQVWSVKVWEATAYSR
jgi:hypothetical protein